MHICERFFVPQEHEGPPGSLRRFRKWSLAKPLLFHQAGEEVVRYRNIVRLTL